jgi:hypothetical protein
VTACEHCGASLDTDERTLARYCKSCGLMSRTPIHPYAAPKSAQKESRPMSTNEDLMTASTAMIQRNGRSIPIDLNQLRTNLRAAGLSEDAIRTELSRMQVGGARATDAGAPRSVAEALGLSADADSRRYSRRR